MVNNLRVLGRWMRMFTIPNQSSVPKVGLHEIAQVDLMSFHFREAYISWSNACPSSVP